MVSTVLNLYLPSEKQGDRPGLSWAKSWAGMGSTSQMQTTGLSNLAFFQSWEAFIFLLSLPTLKRKKSTLQNILKL